MGPGKLLLVMAIVLSLSLSLSLSLASEANHFIMMPSFSLHGNEKLQQQVVIHPPRRQLTAGETLIHTACHGLGPNQDHCSSILNKADLKHKSNATNLALFALRYVEDHAVEVSAGIKKMNAVPFQSPLLQSALSECLDQYNSFDDIIDDVEAAIQVNNPSDARDFAQAAIGNIEQCDDKLMANNEEQKAEDHHLHLPIDLAASNLFLKNMLTAAFNLLK